ncbi:hypothetical protein ACS0TY_014365 [Phlomoides rotata]
MDARGTTVETKVDKGKVVRARRSWSKFEEDALIHCLTDIVNDGWKAENGFKAGFQRELEKKIRVVRVDLDQAGETGDKYVPRMAGFLNEVDDSSICKPSDDGKRSSSKGKKRKSGDADVSTLVDSLGEFMKFSKEAMMRDAVNTTKPEAQQDDGSKNVQLKLIESLKGINGLKVKDKLKVCDEMVQNPLRLDLFLSLPPDEQEEYVWMLLEGSL